MARSGESRLNLERDVTRAIELLEKLQKTEYSAWLGRDVSVDKMRELQRVLQSDLFTSVREVYEKVYDKVDINGPPEVKANAAAKATIALFSSSEGHSHPRVVLLPKTEEGLGFNIVGGQEQSPNCPIFVSRIIPGGVADREGTLKRGDQLLQINGVSMEGETHEKAVSLLKSSGNSVTLVVKYTPRLLDEMENRFDTRRPPRARPK